MQRSNPTQLPGLNQPYTVQYKIEGETAPHYRFILCPRNPSAKYAVRDGELNFRTSDTILNVANLSHSVSQTVDNRFNVHAGIAKNFNEMLSIIRNRNTSVSQVGYVVVDIPAQYFTEQSEISKTKYQPLQNVNKNFIPLTNATIHNDYFISEIKYAIPQANPTYPVYEQFITTETVASVMDNSSHHVNISYMINDNPLVKPNGESFMRVLNYDQSNELKFGNDVVISEHAHLKTVSYRRQQKSLSDWCSNLQPKMNRESYLKLTARQDQTTINAKHVANLFQDYADKGSGFSALIHFHLFRHTANIHKAREIANELKTENFENANATEIADLLVAKFQELASKDSINPKGSFARRINYCLLQLTGGMCHDVKSYLSYQQQNNEENTNKITSP